MSEREGGAHVESGDDRRARLERYLLGGLDEASRQAIREEAIVDPDVHAELREIEVDLLDAAARGTLDADRARLVQEYLIADERNRDAWALAQALAVRSTPQAWAGASRHRRGDGGVRTRARVAWMPAAAAAAAAVIVAAAGIAGYVRWRSSADPREVVPSSPASVARRVPADIPLPLPLPSPAPPIVGTEPGESPSRPAASAPSPDADVRDVDIVAVYFPAAMLRGAKPVVRVDPSARVIQIAFEIDAQTVSTVAVSIRVVPGTGVALWSAADVPVHSRDRVRTATVRVPASLLPGGSYEASVSAAGETGADRVFPFVVRRE